MIFRKGGIRRNIDWITFSLYLALVFVGWSMIYAVGYQEFQEAGLMSSPAGKQLIWIGISFFAFMLLQAIEWRFWQTFAYPIYILTMALLVGVLLFGVTIKGATSWYSFGGSTIQPSEFAKFGTALAIAAYLSTYKVDLRKLPYQATAAGLFMLPAFLILLQPDAGSALVFTSFLLVLYREGLNAMYYAVGFFLVLMLILGLVFAPTYIWVGLLLIGLFLLANQMQPRGLWLTSALVFSAGAIYLLQDNVLREVLIATAIAYALLLLVLLYRRRPSFLLPLTASILIGGAVSFAANYGFNNVLQPHQQDRINVWLNPDAADKRGSYYNILQSKIAIGSGGWTGQGWLKGNMTNLNYVPEQVTDFIFCTIGEEQGFAGVLALIILYLMLLFRLIKIAERQRSDFARIYAYGLLGILFIHFFINIGMTMGLVPVIGIPLPFISKGGSSLLGFTIMIGVLLKMDSHRFRL